MGQNLLVCPLPAFIADVPSQDCPVRFDQIQRMMLTRLTSTSFTVTSILLEATWTPRMTASDDEKIVGTPKFASMVLPMPDPIRTGGDDNTTINGIPVLEGLARVSITGLLIRNMNAEVSKALRSLTAESAPQPGETNLGVYFINRFKQIIFSKGTGTPALAEPFPIYNFVVSDVGSEGYNKDNTHSISFDLEGGWSENFDMLQITEFNPLTIKNEAP
jgi:hypothetical protein